MALVEYTTCIVFSCDWMDEQTNSYRDNYLKRHFNKKHQ
ncbi:hypothetical protein BMETH_1888_0 [methanotrophic bacterial endosymbiont of Bathymodiolus sp.]|nr:hypothetical protein BMETH_1888_0 [methanotrophic bacterial endosymbiont of Bathymodiolus sp.]